VEKFIERKQIFTKRKYKKENKQEIKKDENRNKK
jgi:hypothetical protein